GREARGGRIGGEPDDPPGDLVAMPRPAARAADEELDERGGGPGALAGLGEPLRDGAGGPAIPGPPRAGRPGELDGAPGLGGGGERGGGGQERLGIRRGAGGVRHGAGPRARPIARAGGGE